ncbi:MAG: DNA translocase FtsK [Thermoanaerobaculia bacterium]
MPVRKLPPGKGSELLGIGALLAALLLLTSFVSHRPTDPSLLHQTTGEAVIRNWIGPVGAELSALGFGFLGLAAFLLPILLGVAAWRRLKRQTGPLVFGRGLGGVVLVAGVPGLLQLALGAVPWRGVDIAAGGGLGVIIVENLERTLGFVGATLVLMALVMAGSALVIQSTLGEVLSEWVGRIRRTSENVRFGLSRRRQRREKDKSRERVVSKHLKRAADRRRAAAPTIRTDAALDLPMRVTEKKGSRRFSIRKVKSAGPATPAVEAVPVRERSVRPGAAFKRQSDIPFEEPPTELEPLPPINLLKLEAVKQSVEPDELVKLGDLIRTRCAEFGVEGSIEAITPGPVITTYEFQPAPGVKVSQIVNLQDDLALALKAEAVRIERLPGRSTLGIEVPNKDRAIIRLGQLLNQDAFRHAPSVLTMALGTTIHGEPYYADLATMPHLLVAGATGAGKSVGLQSMITSMVYKARRDEVQFIFIDPKRIELGVYKNIPHLKTEVVVEPKKAANALRWAVGEMERRYRMLAEVHVRSIAFYNQAIADPKVRERLALTEGESEHSAEDLKPLPYYVIVIDELADLMMVASSEVEASIARLAQMARAVGIHLIVSTQRPSVDVLTGTIKANFPCRIAFATATRHDSRTILDQVGAEKLLGNGDMLLMPPGTSRVMRLHGTYVSEQETAALVRWLKKRGTPELDLKVLEAPEEESKKSGGGSGDDELFDEAARLVVAERQASASFLQRRMRVGFSRAARLIDIMEQEGLLGPPQGSKPREVLVPVDYFEQVDGAKAEWEA